MTKATNTAKLSVHTALKTTEENSCEIENDMELYREVGDCRLLDTYLGSDPPLKYESFYGFALH